MVVKKFFKFFILIVLFSLSNIWATDYYVSSSNGSDYNSGTSSSSPWKSLSKVNARKFNPGDKILFKRGDVWNDKLVIKGTATSSSYITVGAYGSGNLPVIDYQGSSSAYSVYVDYIDYVKVQNLHIKTGWDGRFGGGIRIQGQHNIVENCLVEGDRSGRTPQLNGIVGSYKCHGLIIRNNTVRHLTRGIKVGTSVKVVAIVENNKIDDLSVGNPNDMDGINYNATSSGDFTGSVIRNNTITRWGDDAIDVWDTKNIIIEKNIIHDPLSNGYEGNGIKMGSSKSSGTVVRWNVIYNLFADGTSGGKGWNLGITTNGATNTKIYGNLIYNTIGNGIRIAENTSNHQVYNNTVLLSSKASSELRYAINVEPNAKGVTLKNNITRGKTSDIRVCAGSAVSGGYNVLINSRSVMNSGSYSGSSSDYYRRDPQFVDPSRNNYKLKSTSPCIRSGVSISGYLFDIEGIKILSGIAPNRGAYQSTSSSTGSGSGGDVKEDNSGKLSIANVTASSYLNHPNKTLDGKGYSSGDNSSRWTTSQSRSQWITYDLGGLKTVHGIRVSFYGYNNNVKHKYQILASADNKSWYYLVSSATSKLQEWNTWNFRGINMRYVKVLVNYVENASTPSIWEVEIFDDSNLKKENLAEESESELQTPDQFELAQNYPNPFNPSTVIKYALPVESQVKIVIYNMLGEVVSELLNSVKTVGNHEVNWNASGLASGTYIYSLEVSPLDGSAGFKAVKKMSLVK